MDLLWPTSQSLTWIKSPTVDLSALSSSEMLRASGGLTLVKVSASGHITHANVIAIKSTSTSSLIGMSQLVLIQHCNMTINFGSTGYSVNLFKENTVHSGQFKLLLEVSDLQHKTAVDNLSVTVCNCFNIERPNCLFPKASGSTVGGAALGTIFFSILLLAGRTHTQNTLTILNKITFFCCCCRCLKVVI